MNKPFSPACERNQDPILAILRTVLPCPVAIGDAPSACGAAGVPDVLDVLEIGSGTGQHAVHFARHLPYLRWQTSDLPENHPGIEAWRTDAALENVLSPLSLDMQRPVWPGRRFDAVYSANTAHIMSWQQVETMIAGVAGMLVPDGRFCLYGPFKYEGNHTSAGNATFDAALRADAPHRGIRDIEDVRARALAAGLILQADHAMPANNRLLVFVRSSRALVASCN